MFDLGFYLRRRSYLNKYLMNACQSFFSQFIACQQNLNSLVFNILIQQTNPCILDPTLSR